MSVTKSFYNCVEEGDLTRVHVMMIDSLLMDLTFNDYKTMDNVASEKFTNLYDLHDRETFIEDKLKWNDEYLSAVQVKLMNNFSKQRVEHLKKVVLYLNPSEPKKNSDTKIDNKHNKNHRYMDNSSDYKRQKQRDEEKGRVTRVHKCAFAAASGAVVGGAGFYAAGFSVAGGLAAGAVAGATVGYVLTKGEEE